MDEKDELEVGQENDSAGLDVSSVAEPKKPENQAIPYERFKEVIDQKNQLESRLKDLEDAEKKRQDEAEKKRQERMKEQQQFQELADELQGRLGSLEPELETTKTELETTREVLNNYAKTQMELVPEPFREIVERLPVLERLQWLSENAEKLSVPDSKRGIPSSPKPKGQPEMTVEERRRRAAKTF